MERLVSVKELAALIGLSPSTIYALAERREIPVQRVRRRVMFSPQQITRWLGQQAIRESIAGGARSMRGSRRVLNAHTPQK